MLYLLMCPYDVIIMRSLGVMCECVQVWFSIRYIGHGEVGGFRYRVMMAVVAI